MNNLQNIATSESISEGVSFLDTFIQFVMTYWQPILIVAVLAAGIIFLVKKMIKFAVFFFIIGAICFLANQYSNWDPNSVKVWFDSITQSLSVLYPYA